MDLCLNEALANVLEHGGEAALATSIEIGVEFECSKGNQSVTLRIIDGGVPFDVPQSIAKTPAPSLTEATPGGLGVKLLRRNADTFSYRLHQGKNELTLGFVK
jgi:anti-sigma regulatory factor (Ser/Thr protein kinase)